MTVQKSITHKLLVPVTFEGKEHTEITLRRLKYKDLKATFKEDDADQLDFITSRLSGWPIDAVEEIDPYDMEDIREIIDFFSSRRASKTAKLPRNS
ncbi:phage tail assembly protein [Bartonella grahamii]|uniref:phage tail assembly protein n=1 Tax=Bartonella grahamii TaxID=33045 RepID=UPI002E7B5EC5|nr:phage tail assembly protein [Bartonella grahamii]